MLRATLFFLRRACFSLALTPRVIRGDASYTLGKFIKSSVVAFRTAEKNTHSKTDEATCEKCKRLIELVFGPSSPPDTTTVIKITKQPEAVPHINAPNKEPPGIISQRIHKTPHKINFGQRYLNLTPPGKGHGVFLNNVGNVPTDCQLNATTDKQTEEQLTQKVETLNETPLVEAEKPVIDGFNAPPRVLDKANDKYLSYNLNTKKMDNIDSIIDETKKNKQPITAIDNFAPDQQNRRPGASAETDLLYDEIAKRCLNGPSHKIDKHILKELEKLAVPQTSLRGESSMIEENIIKIDDLKKPRKPAKKIKIDLEASEFEHDRPLIAYIDNSHPANSPRLITDDEIDRTALQSERLYDLDKTPLMHSYYTAAVQKPPEMDAHEDARFELNDEYWQNYDPNKVIIDPYDKKTLIHEKCEEEYNPYLFRKYLIPLPPVQENQKTNETENLGEQSPVAYPDVQSVQGQEKTEPYIVFDSYPAKAPSDVGQFSELQPTHTKTIFDDLDSSVVRSSSKLRLPEATKFPYYDPVSELTDTNMHADKERLYQSTYQYSAPLNATNETLRYDTLQGSSNETVAYVTPEDPAEEIFPYNIPHELIQLSEATSFKKADFTNIEPTAPEKANLSETTEIYKHDTSKQILFSRTSAEPSDEIQKTLTAVCNPIPKLKVNETESLSEMLKNVRLRSKTEYCQEFHRQMEPETGKCGKKPPPCPSPAPKCPSSPPCPPSPPPCRKPACPPPTPRPCPPPCPAPCPPPCPSPCPAPAKRSPSCQKFKFPVINLKDFLPVLLQPENDVQKHTPTLCIQILEVSRAIFRMEIMLMLMRVSLLKTLPLKRMISLTTSFEPSITLARDYEPWVPIPSWPIPKKEKKRPFVCPKEGCKLIPPPKLRPTCNENPCINFPRKDTFSIAKFCYIENSALFSELYYVDFDIIY